MFRIALRSLMFERGKLLAAMAGVSFAASLVLAQSGLYVGFRTMATSVITRVGGDLWVMARGTQLLDFADGLSPAARAAVTTDHCVTRARGVIFAWATIRKPSGGVDNVQLIGYEPVPGAVLPWSMTRGLPSDLHAPMRIAVDQADVDRLEIGHGATEIGNGYGIGNGSGYGNGIGNGIGSGIGLGSGIGYGHGNGLVISQTSSDPVLGRPVQLNGRTVYVGALTRGVRSFTVVPYLFAEARTAQRVLGLGEGQYTYWALDLAAPDCRDRVIAAIGQRGDLDVRTASEFRDMTSSYWIERSGAGATLAFAALLGLVVGVVIVGQTLYAMTESRIRELATLKAMGASSRELLGFVGWQAGFLAVAGGALGCAMALGMKHLVALAGLTMVLSPGVLALGLGSVGVMCALASLASVRKVLALGAAEVFR